jgi:GNAT superfamily N-acetyltransferase
VSDAAPSRSHGAWRDPRSIPAAFWRSNVARPQLDEALTNPELARYVQDFGCPGDFGVVAEEGAEPLGAAWWRYFQAGAPGYGFVDEATPEISAAVLPGHRRRGIGTALLGALQREARIQRIDRLSLSVEQDNPAIALYERLGVRPLDRERDALTNGDRTPATTTATELLTGRT